MRRRRLLLLCLPALAGALGPWPRAGAEPPARVAPEDDLAGALARLESPFARERREAAQMLAALLPGSRQAVLSAWRAGSEMRRCAMTGILAADGSPESLRLLVEAWLSGGEALGVRARQALLRDPVAARRALAAARAQSAAGTPAAGSRTLDDLDRLLVRDEVENLFLNRRSRSGGTGYYRGQFAVLLPHREVALEVCFHVLTDRALPLPGTPAAGGYRFLRPVNEVVDIWDVREMALSAVADLAQPTDADLVRRLEGYYTYLLRLKSDEEAGFLLGDPERNMFLDGVLATLFRLDPFTWRRRLEQRIRELWGGGRGFTRSVVEMQMAAALTARAGLYGEAAEKYRALLALRSNQTRATDCYNLACAYASWSLEPGSQNPAVLRERALDYLEEAVDESWSDLAWMEEDGDLEPLRSSPRYARLVARVRAALEPEPEEKPGAPAPR